ncbi:MAG: family 16 glycosylhydrolase [Ignavibacteriae bacterium]|nr:family 16 glycosylhydrolase [Ignavibacteriota bacterium]
MKIIFNIKNLSFFQQVLLISILANIIFLKEVYSQKNKSDLERIKYLNENLIVDLRVGLWAWSLPTDYGNEGDNDLLDNCHDKPYNGIYFNETLKIYLEKNWRFLPDENNVGISAKWYAIDFDDSKWVSIDAGERWENQGYPNLDGIGWYRKKVYIPNYWNEKEIWIKFSGVNDAYKLFVNGEYVSSVGEANISFAGKASFTNITKNIFCGKENLISVQVNDFGNSGGLWQLPIFITTDENETKNLFKPISSKPFIPEEMGYKLFWEDEFNGIILDKNKWQVRGVGPRAAGFVSSEAVKVNNGFLELSALKKGDSILVCAVGTQNLFMTKYGYFECHAQLQKSEGNWAAFWIQSPGISKGEDPAKFGTEIDIMEYFKKNGDNFVSHNLHWAYGPNQQTIGGLQSFVEGVNEGFHTFSLEWTPEKYVFFVDGLKYYEVNKAISHIDEYIVLSMELPNKLEELVNSKFPDVFIIDYMKVYKKE